MGKLYIVEWHNEEAREYVDIIPAEVLEVDTPLKGMRHTMIGRDGGVIEAAYDVERQSDGSILLRYGGANTDHNDASGIYIGDVIIGPGIFADASALGWREPAMAEFESLPVTVTAGFMEGSSTVSQVKRIKRSERLRKLVHALGQHRGECDACGSKPHPGYGEAGYAMFEAHHVDPLYSGLRSTSIGDIAYLCANCHRVITVLGNPSLESFIIRLRGADSQE